MCRLQAQPAGSGGKQARQHALGACEAKAAHLARSPCGAAAAGRPAAGRRRGARMRCLVQGARGPPRPAGLALVPQNARDVTDACPRPLTGFLARILTGFQSLLKFGPNSCLGPKQPAQLRSRAQALRRQQRKHIAGHVAAPPLRPRQQGAATPALRVQLAFHLSMYVQAAPRARHSAERRACQSAGCAAPQSSASGELAVRRRCCGTACCWPQMRRSPGAAWCRERGSGGPRPAGLALAPQNARDVTDACPRPLPGFLAQKAACPAINPGAR